MSWPNFWTEISWKTKALMPLSAWVCKMALKRRKKLQKPLNAAKNPELLKVCVVGNLVVGGSGKTPFIIWLVKSLQQKGIKVGIVSRGYGGKSKTWPQFVDAQSDPKLVGDEPVMLAKALKVPIAVSPKRIEAVALLSKNTDCDWLIADDGLQHFAMPRDCEVVITDAQRLFGNQQCLPAGPLREPLDRLSMVDAWVLNGETNLEAFHAIVEQHEVSVKPLSQMRLVPVCLRNVLDEQKTLPLEALQNRHVHAIAGIGNPQRFFESLQSLGANVDSVAFADHQAYRVEDLQRFNTATGTAAPNSLSIEKHRGMPKQLSEVFDLENALIMTHKDAVKCLPIARQIDAFNWWYLEIAPQVDEQVLQLILAKMSAKHESVEHESVKH